MLPGHLAGAGAMVREAGQGEKQVGEAIQVDDGKCRQLDVALKPHDVSLGAPADCPRNVKRGGLGCPTRNDESTQWLELRLTIVDGVLELSDSCLVDACFLEVRCHPVPVRCGEECPDREQVALDGDEHLVDARHHLDAARHSEDGVQLVDVTICFDAKVVLGHAAPTEEPGLAGVSGFCVDLHWWNIRLPAAAPPRWTADGSRLSALDGE